MQKTYFAHFTTFMINYLPMLKRKKFVLTFSCKDQLGIVAKVTTFLAEHQGDILESTQYSDVETDRFFMRCVFEYQSYDLEPQEFSTLFSPLAASLNISWEYHSLDVKSRLLILVSGYDHCLKDLLHRMRSNALPIEIPAIVSNHPDLSEIAAWYKIPFYYFPVTKETKTEQESRIFDLIHSLQIDVTVLARYMQILSPSLTAKLYGRAINIHHSFLPSFKGARPYHQAHERGVKLIGATAHYVSDELDEGPIIEQEVVRVDHSYSPEKLIELGKDIESQVLARAIKFHVERRVFLNERRTVVFR